ncbi:DUF932 domain-containing protein [bacterium]|nr:DUF932 domain-containing protein [bacterium]
MAHNIDISTGKPAFAFTGPRPWHGLGIEVPGLMTTREALVAGGLDWTVSKRALMTADADALPVDSRFAIVRDDTKAVLGSVGSDYTTVQNAEAISVFDEALGPANARVEAVGALGRGERVFALARLHDGTFEPAPGDQVEPYFLMTTAHDGSGCVTLLFTTVRVVCQNTLTAAIRGARREIRVKHTQGVHEGLKLAPMILAESETYWSRLRETLAGMASRQADRERVRRFLSKLFPDYVDENGQVVPKAHVLKLRETVEGLFDGGAIGADLAGRSDYALYNAVADYIDHHKTLRSGRTWEWSVFGAGSVLRQRAFDLLTAPVLS